MVHTCGLFAQTGFIQGAARVLDLGSRLNRHVYNYSLTPDEADAWALYRDWMALGDDMRGALVFEGTPTDARRNP